MTEMDQAAADVDLDLAMVSLVEGLQRLKNGDYVSDEPQEAEEQETGGSDTSERASPPEPNGGSEASGGDVGADVD